VWLMFLYPLNQAKEESRQLERMYFYQETVRFVDSVRNTGVIEADDMEAYLEKMYSGTGRYEVELMHESAVGVGADEEIFSRKWYNEDIYAALETDQKYRMNQNDFLKVTVYEDEKMILCYGGCIRAEDEDTP
jgi:hypothetical protein